MSKADRSPANANAAILDEVNCAAAWFQATKTEAVWAKRLEADRAIETLEGPTVAKTGDYLCRGVAGELWSQSYQRLHEKYEATDEVDSDGFRKHVPTSEVMAAQIAHPFHLTTSWGDLDGKAGDYLLKCYEDKEVEYPVDVWIVDQQLFGKTYQRVEE